MGHSWGGGVALRAASLAPDRVRAVVLLAGVGPGCDTSLDWLLAAPGIGALSSLLAFRWTPWIARARLAWLRRRHGRLLYPGESASLQVWAYADESRWPLWRTFLIEQRALLRELGELAAAAESVQVPVLLIADPADRVVPVKTSHRLAEMLPDARLILVEGAGHHLPRRAPRAVADAIAQFLAEIDMRPAGRRSRRTAPAPTSARCRRRASRRRASGTDVLEVGQAVVCACRHRSPLSVRLSRPAACRAVPPGARLSHGSPRCSSVVVSSLT